MAAAAATRTSVIANLELLNLKNYEDWSFRVKTYLLAEDLWDVVEGAAESPTREDGGESKFKAWRRNNAKALYAIQSSCGAETYSFIRGISKAKDAWDTLAVKSKPDNQPPTNTPAHALSLKAELAELAQVEAERSKKVHLMDTPTDYVGPSDGDGPKNDLAIEEHVEEEESTPADEVGPTTVSGPADDDGPIEDLATEAGVEEEESSDDDIGPSDGDVPKNELAIEEQVEEEGSDVNSVDARTEDVGTDGDEPTKDLGTEVHAEGDVESEEIIASFVDLVESNDWDAAMKFVKQYPKVASARLSNGGTALHAAALQKKGDVGIELVKLMTPKDLEIPDNEGYIALHNVVLRSPPDNFELVKFMVERNNKLLSIPGPRDGRTSLLLAQMMDSGERVARYLYSLIDPSTLSRQEAADLICHGLKFKRYDVAWDLIQRDVSYALEMINENCPYTQLASLRSEVFLSGTKLTFWEKWIYNRIFIKPSPTIAPTVDDDSKKEPTPITDETRIDVKDKEKDKDNQRHLLSSGRAIIQKFRTNAAGLFSRGLQVGSVVKNVKLFGIERIYRLKVIHVRVHEFLERMCEVVKPGVLDQEQLQAVYKGIFLAIDRGHIEFVSRICQTYPLLLRSTRNENNQSIYQVSAASRKEKIFNLIYHLDEGLQRTRVSESDYFGNNMLHIIGSYSPLAQNNLIRGPALQMQRELQWYQEVESIAGPGVLEMLNEEGKAPQELFTETHKDLVKKGEESMKDTATSCTVVGALIVTIMFAAAFTVPGGNNGNTGLPMFLRDKVFKIFIMSDVISLSASTTSVIIFLGILTSRFAEKDFLISLPTRMILGLSALFISISAMMVAFSTAIFLMLHGNLSIVIPTIVCVSVPIISFVWMQFPFLLEILISTYGSGVFKKNVERWT